MPYEMLRYEVHDGLATLTMQRPEAYNALNLQLVTELHDAVVTCSEDDAVRAVVLTGSGRAFCAGGDVKGFGEEMAQIGKHLKILTLALHAAISRLVRMPKPTISAVNGVAAGGGMSLALAGDLIVATESARFTMAYTQIGASPDGSASFFLPRLVGVKRALELTYLNRTLSAHEALEWGIVTQVIPDAHFQEAVLALALQLAHGPTQAYGRAKALLYNSSHETLETQMEHEAQLIAASGHTADFREGVNAFVAKRPPVFHGR